MTNTPDTIDYLAAMAANLRNDAATIRATQR